MTVNSTRPPTPYPIADARPQSRRALLSAVVLPWIINGCSSPLPLVAPRAKDAGATALLQEAAQAQGLEAFKSLTDINVSYSGQWRPLVGRIQPEVVDAGFRGTSQERLMPAERIVAQAFTGPMGNKQVSWRRGARRSSLGDVAVWFNGVRSDDDAARNAAALVAEAYGLFLLGPLWLVDRDLPIAMSGNELVDGRRCDVMDVWLQPGLGRVAADRIAFFIDRGDGLLRRLRFTLEGTVNTRGAVAEVDLFEHERRFGVMWPMRFYERVVYPISLPAHDWRVTGLDVNRGYGVEDVTGPRFLGAAAANAMQL